eukprot:5249742-Amphidinium_carterae.1
MGRACLLPVHGKIVTPACRTDKVHCESPGSVLSPGLPCFSLCGCEHFARLVIVLPCIIAGMNCAYICSSTWLDRVSHKATLE